MMTDPKNTRSLDELIELVSKGARPKYQFFWGHTPKVPGQVDQSCLSNWFPAAFTLDGVHYPTTEHYMMAEKARLFGDHECLERILDSKSPGAAKRLGRQVKDFNDQEWIANRFEIVTAGNVGKFRQNGEMGNLLIQTGSKVLVEASPRDSIWGIGMGRDNSKATDPRQWNGLNLLGFALMEARARLLTKEQT